MRSMPLNILCTLFTIIVIMHTNNAYICIYMNNYESVIGDYYEYVRFTIMVTQKVLTLT